MSQPVLCLLGVCSHLSKESRAAEDRGKKSESSKRSLQTSLGNHKEQCTAWGHHLSLSLAWHPWSHHPLLMTPWLLFLAQVSFCRCSSLLSHSPGTSASPSFFCFSLSSCCLCASSPAGPNSNFLTLSLVIYRSASLLHLLQVRFLPLTPPKRELPPSCSPVWWEQSCSAGSSGRSSTASGACCLSHKHPRRHIWLRLLTSSVILFFFF